MIFIIDDDKVMAKCVERAIKSEVRIFTNAIEAMNAIIAGNLPEMILLDILLTGPDAFTFLNELVSYADTAKIPIVIVSSLDFSKQDLSEYGVVGYLNKDTMTPEEIEAYVTKYTK